MLSNMEDSPMGDVADYWFDDPGDYPKIECARTQDAHIRLLWNLEHYPIPEGEELPNIRHTIELALERLGLRGYVEISLYGGKLSYTEDELLCADFSHEPRTKGSTIPGSTIAGHMCVDMLGKGSEHIEESLFVVLAKRPPNCELTRVLECLNSTFHQPYLTIEPCHGLLDSPRSLLKHTLVVPEQKTRLPWLIPLDALPETGVFWDAWDCPFPPRSTPDSIYNRARSAFTARFNVSATMSVYAYVDDRKESSREFLDPNSSWESSIDFQPVGIFPISRHERMINDILLWSLCRPNASHLIVVGKIYKNMFQTLETLADGRYFGVVLRPTNDTVLEILEWPAYLLDQVFPFGLYESESESERPRHPKKLETGEGSEERV